MTEAGDATAAVILLIQLQDLRRLRSEGEDFALAARLYEEELYEEAQAVINHHIGHRNEIPPASPLPSATRTINESNHGLGSINIEHAAAANSQSSDSPNLVDEFEAFYEPLTHCVACDDVKASNDTLTVPCNHDYCDVCINERFDLASKDESMWPASCCNQEIPLQQAQPFLEMGVLKQFQAKSEEFGTRDRTYCSQPDCSVFISPNLIDGDKGSCIICGTETCTVCKAAAHDGDCPNHPAVQSLMRFAERRGLRQCYSCKRMIELDTGCFHIVCHCRAEFCYKCGAKWKTCGCEMWDEDRLLVAAEDMVERENHLGAPLNIQEAQAHLQQYQQLVIDRAQVRRGEPALRLVPPRAPLANPPPLLPPHLQPRPRTRRGILEMQPADRDRLRSECRHDDWHPVGVERHLPDGVGQQCERCRQRQKRYLLECRNCKLRLCARCRRRA